MTESNPLLVEQLRIPFDRIAASDVAPAVDRLLEQAKSAVEAVVARQGTRTFANTLDALDRASLGLDFAMGVVSHLESVATYPELREAYNAVLPRVSEFRAKLILDERIWEALTAFAETDEAKTLDAAKKRYLTRTLAFFRNHGAGLSKEKKARLIEIDSELSTVSTKFSQNVLDSLNEFEFIIEDEKRLAGLPESARALGSTLAKAKGLDGWRFTLQMPSYLAIMTYLDDRGIREKFYRAYMTVASSGQHSNVDLMYRILELRAEKASILGFADFADFVLNDRMAKNGQDAHRFVDDLAGRIEPYFKRETAELLDFIRKQAGAGFAASTWDLMYYAEKLRKERYDFDEEAVRQYFPLPAVLKGMFELFGGLFGIRVEEAPDFPVWDPAVKTYKVSDTDGTLVGYFYSDIFPRENKRGGAWMDSFLTHVEGDPATPPHLGLIAGNFSPPTDGKPALLTHDEVNTLFHEFGHLLHHLFTKVRVRGQAMSGVAWDFIEFPSQILENWCFEKEAIDLFARHHETGEKLPDNLFEKIRRAQNFRRGSFYIRQLSFGALDFLLHRSYDREKDGAILPYAKRHLDKFSAVPLPEGYAWLCSFSHIFGAPVGYASGYYSYLWAEVLEADAFSRFKQDGVLNAATGRALREKVLSRGDSEDPAVLFRAFVGRDPDPSALLTRAELV